MGVLNCPHKRAIHFQDFRKFQRTEKDFNWKE